MEGSKFNYISEIEVEGGLSELVKIYDDVCSLNTESFQCCIDSIKTFIDKYPNEYYCVVYIITRICCFHPKCFKLYADLLEAIYQKQNKKKPQALNYESYKMPLNYNHEVVLKHFRKIFAQILKKRNIDILNNIPDATNQSLEDLYSIFPPDSMEYAILYDDVEKFQKFYLGEKPPSSYHIVDHRTCLQDNIAKLCANLGAINCFKFLQLNEISHNYLHFNDTILGGNFEIIKYFEDNNIESGEGVYRGNTFIMSCMYNQNFVADWCLENKAYTRISPDEIIESGNIRALIFILQREKNGDHFILDKVCDIGSGILVDFVSKMKGETPLNRAARSENF